MDKKYEQTRLLSANKIIIILFYPNKLEVYFKIEKKKWTTLQINDLHFNYCPRLSLQFSMTFL